MFKSRNFHEFFDNTLDNFLDLDENIFFSIDLKWAINIHWHFHSSFNFSDDLHYNLFFHYFFHYLRNLDNLFDYTRHHNNLLYNLLNLDYFWYFDHLLDDLFNEHSHLLYSIHDTRDFHNLLFDVSVRLWHLDVLVDNFLNFYNFGFFYDKWVSDGYLFDDRICDSFNDGDVNDLLNNLEDFMNYWNLNNSFNFNKNFFRNFNNLCFYNLNFFNSFLNNDFLNNNLFLNNFLCKDLNLNYFLNNLRHFHDLLDNFLDIYWLLYNSFYDLMLNFNVVHDFPSISILHHWNYLFHDLFNLDYLWNFDFHLNNFLHDNLHFDDSFDYLFDWDNLLPCYLNLFVLFFDVVDHSFHLDDVVNFNNPISEAFNLDYCWLLDNSVDNFLNDGWNFHNFLDGILNSDGLVNNSIIHDRNFERNVDNPINLDVFLNLHNFFNYLFDSDHLRYFNNFFHNFLDNLFHFYNFWDNSEDLQNVIDIDYSHDLLFYHSHDAFVHLRNHSTLYLHFFELLEEGFDEDS